MKKSKLICSLGVLALASVSPFARADVSPMKTGKPELKAMSQLAFGPGGVLFIADTKTAAIFAIATGDTTAARDGSTIRAEAINQKIAALVGTSIEEIVIEDLAVNPISRKAYLAIARGRGPDATPLARAHQSRRPARARGAG